MKRTVLIATLLFSIFKICLAQNDWQPGYIIKIEGDTIYGLIDNRNSKVNSLHCFFRKNEKDVNQIYTPQELAGYRFTNNRYYISKVIKGLNNDEPVFLEFLILGELNVYHFKGEESKYYVEKESEIHELKNTSVVTYKYDTDYLFEKKEYLGILNHLLSDANMKSDIDAVELKAKPLIKVAKKYHEIVCPEDKCIIYAKEVKPTLLFFGFHAGTSIGKLDFGNEITSKYGVGQFIGIKLKLENFIDWEENINAELGLNFHLINNYNLVGTGRMYLTDKNVAYILTNDPYFLENVKNSVNTYHVNLKYLSCKLPIVLNYTFSKGKLKPSIGGGLINNLTLSQNRQFNIHRFTEEFGSTIPKYQFGLLGKANIEYQILEKKFLYFDLTYEKSSSFQFQDFMLRSNMLSLSAGVTF